ncbi:GemA protein [Acinetobacter sp. ANC 4470]|uniref:gp16 family protein n=1 Tax=Acinetobacter sp. ANC 4470 TaxID=1977881 RepID=UPI000A33AFD9|nr:regulatory protein GemA [Acinetobacter sp. ANC 4470]OTG68290.1 GemA protein [Acinetobacter sp. ANC 4470]
MKKASRNQRIAAIHMGKKSLNLDDDTYRDMLEQVTGKRSAKDMTDDDLVKVIQHLDQLGFSKRNFGEKPKVKLSKEALMSKIEAHLAENKLHWNYAKGIAKQMFQKEALEFCTENQLWRIVAALEYKKKRDHETRRVSGQTT